MKVQLSSLVLLLPLCVRSFAPTRSSRTSSNLFYFNRKQEKEPERTYPEADYATYEMSKVVIPFEGFDAGLVRPLLKQTQLENRKLQVVYDANKDGFNPRAFHAKVDGKGASIVVARCGTHIFGGYNPRGWASLGGSRPSVASFLFYRTLFGWQKVRVKGRGGNACSKDEFDTGIHFGADGLVIPLNSAAPRNVASRLGMYFDTRPDGKATLLPKAGKEYKLDDLKVLSGVYEPGEGIPNSGGVTDLGLY